MIAEAFHPEHMRELAPRLQAAQRAEYASAEPDYFDLLAQWPAVTLRVDGVVMACTGVVEIDGKSHLWSFLAEDAGPHMVGLVRAGKRLVEVASRPVMATTDKGFGPGCRLLRMLGLSYLRDENGKHLYVLEAA
jgi:hypothetical protein